MFKLRIYKLSGADKGNLDHEEFFSTREEMEERYKECVEIVRGKLKNMNVTLISLLHGKMWTENGKDWRDFNG